MSKGTPKNLSGAIKNAVEEIGIHVNAKRAEKIILAHCQDIINNAISPLYIELDHMPVTQQRAMHKFLDRMI